MSGPPLSPSRCAIGSRVARGSLTVQGKPFNLDRRLTPAVAGATHLALETALPPGRRAIDARTPVPVNLSMTRENHMPFARLYETLRTRTPFAALVPAVCLAALAGSPVAAQDQRQPSAPASAETQMTRPAPILVIYKEDVKAGRVTSHDQLEENFARTYAKMPGSRHYVAMNSISGPNEAWFLQPYNSLEEVERESQANEHAPVAIKTNLEKIGAGEIDDLTNQTAITTIYRDDLSFNVNMANLPKCRYVEVVTYRVRPGHDADFMEGEKLLQSAYQKANVPMQWATYQVFAGAPSGTYYVFRAIDSLAKADPTNREMMQTVDQALGTDGEKRLMQLVSDGIVMREVNLYAFNPKTSYAPPEFAAADSFWSQPAQMAQVGTTGKTTKATAAKGTKGMPAKKSKQ